MALVKRVEKKARMSKRALIKYQILTQCFFSGVQISDADLESLALLAESGEQELTLFCLTISDMSIFKSPQSARNAVAKAERKNLVVKAGNNKKTIRLNPDIQVQSDGNILLEYKFVSLES